MYPHQLTFLHSGVYILERPESKSYVEILELRPDMYVSWAQVPDPDEENTELDYSGNWAISPDSMSVVLMNEDSGDSLQFNFILIDEHWLSTNDPEIVLRKRSGYENLKGPFYFDER